MNKLPKISIVTPSFNQAKFIERTIKSVLEQNYPHLEYIVMDGGSTDGTLEILKKYGSKIVWRSEGDKGQADAINKGLKLATGEILAYLNSDDVYEKGTLLKVARFFQTHSETAWVFGKCKIINEHDQEVRSWITAYKNFFLERYHYASLLVLDYISQPAVFWRRKILDEIGFLDEKEYYELDYDYWLRIGKIYPPGFIDDYLASFRVHQAAKTSQNASHFWQELRVAKKYTSNPLLLFLHFFNFLSIILVYPLISKLKR